MSRTSIDAGKLTEGLQVLALQEVSPNTWDWTSMASTKGQVELSTAKKNLFSSVGIGARAAQVLIRRQAITLHNALLWTDFLSGARRHLFLTSIVPEGRLHLRLEAALVEMVQCLASRTADTVGTAGRPVSTETMRLAFPGVLTEKYARYEREETHAEQETGYVLVVPKPIVLRPGDLITVQDGPARAVYNVAACHVLDPYKNEYEIVWRRDV